MTQAMRKFSPREEVDFAIIGSGAAGGVLAKELSTAGFSVLVLEQGPYLQKISSTMSSRPLFKTRSRTTRNVSRLPSAKPNRIRRTCSVPLCTGEL
jgi:choline dehydrogenase-like flavoprotein